MTRKVKRQQHNNLAKPAAELAPKRHAQAMTGIAWYSADQWDHFRAVAADAAILHTTFAEWQVSALEGLQKMQAMGMDVRPVPVDVDAMLRWCVARNIPFDSVARSKYVAERLEQAQHRLRTLKKDD